MWTFQLQNILLYYSPRISTEAAYFLMKLDWVYIFPQPHFVIYMHIMKMFVSISYTIE